MGDDLLFQVVILDFLGRQCDFTKIIRQEKRKDDRKEFRYEEIDDSLRIMENQGAHHIHNPFRKKETDNPCGEKDDQRPCAASLIHFLGAKDILDNEAREYPDGIPDQRCL